MPHRKRKDINQKQIIEALNKLGASVINLSNVGGGVPDIIVGFRGLTIPIEIKNDSNWYGKKGLSTSQKTFRASWRGGEIYTANTIDDIINILQSAED